MTTRELADAAFAGDVGRLRALLDAGVDVNGMRPSKTNRSNA